MSARFVVCFLTLGLLGCPTAPAPDPLPEPPKVARFTATPTTVARGGTVTLRWETSNAETVELVDLNRGALAGAANRASGEATVQITEPTVFVVSARNSRGARVSAVASVGVDGVDPAGLLFSAFPPVVTPGQTGTLVWNAPGARQVSITPTGGQPLDLKGQTVAGSVQIAPTGPTTYTLSADGARRTIDVRVGQAVLSFTASRQQVRAGDQVTLSWRTTNATRVRLVSAGRGTLKEVSMGAEIAQGSFTDTVLEQIDGSSVVYELEVEGAQATVRQPLVITYGRTLEITSLTTLPFAKENTTFAVAWTTVGADRIEIVADGALLYRSPTAANAASGTVQLPAPRLGPALRHTFKAIIAASGATVTRDFVVTGVTDVDPNPTLTATPATVAAGAPVTLSWSAPGSVRTRLLENGEVTVGAIEGFDGGGGSITVFPNSPNTTYELVASNTLEPVARARTSVAVSAPIGLVSADGGVVFQAEGTAQIVWTAPNDPSLQGFPLPQPVTSTAASDFIDISSTGTPLTFTNSLARVDVPAFEAFIFGRRFDTTMWVSTNGFVQFSTLAVTNPRPVPVALPAAAVPGGFVAPLWLGLEVGNGRVFWELRGTAPDREVIVQWNQVRVRGAPSKLATFQARIHQLGTVTFSYRTVPTGLPTAPVSGYQGAPNFGIATPSTAVADGSTVTFQGITRSPSIVSTQGESFGFLKLGSSVMRVSFDSLIRPQDLQISEVMSRQAPAVAAGQWFEISNLSSATVDLTGWTVGSPDGGTTSLPAGTRISPRSFLVVAGSADAAENDGLPMGTVGVPGLTLGPSLLLSNGRGFLEDFVAPSAPPVGVSLNFDPGPFIGFGADAGTPATAEICQARSDQTYGNLSPPQRGTPGRISTGTCMGYAYASIPPRFKDISSSGRVVRLLPDSPFFPAEDEGTGTVDIGTNPVQLFGRNVTELTVSSNGWLIPRGGYTGGAGFEPKDSPNNDEPRNGVVAPFWDDLELPASRPGAQIYVQRFNANADPAEPRAHWVVQWNRIDFFVPRGDMTFEVKLFDTGDVEFHYAAMTGTGSAGNTATIWLEAFDSSRALVSSIASPVVTPNSAVRFTRIP